MNRTESKKVINVFNVIMNVKSGDETVYQSLVSELLKICEEKRYRREKNTGVVYKQVRAWAYERYKEPMDFLNEVFKGDLASAS